MKILELTNYSAGGCGVWVRVKQEAELLAERGHEVKVFSSNITKGSKIKAPQTEMLGKVEIIRFPAIKLGGESFLNWKFKEEALKFKPDIIFAHMYRHLHTTKALKLAEQIKCKIFLVTHAPFARDESRSSLAKNIVSFYDNFIGPNSLRKFDKVIAITRWEMPHLTRLGLPKEKIKYIPNGIPAKFFSALQKEKEENKILFFGRISPIKNIEVVIRAIHSIKDKKIVLEIAGPAEADYLKKLEKIISEKNLNKRVIFSNAIYSLQKKISKFDSAKIYTLPSKSEGMPQTLIEAMARGKIVIASDNPGSKDIINDGKNGFLFKNNDEKELGKKLNDILEMKKRDLKKIKLNARKTAEEFSCDRIIVKIEELIKE